MKSMIIAAMLVMSLLACTKKEYPPETSSVAADTTKVRLPDSLESGIRTVRMDSRTTCYVLVHTGQSLPDAISCVYK